MRIARTLVVLGTLAAAAATPARAQGNTAEQLQQAIRLYENVEIERSLVILNQIISPESPYIVTEQQRVTAYKYLGAALALQRGQARQDSAVRFFRAALERDPFTDLDAQSFSPAQLQVFGRARGATFAVGLKAVPSDTIDPRFARFRFRSLSTHPSRVRLEIRTADDRVQRVVYEGDNDGLREIEWDGITDEGRLLPAGRYELVLLGESRVITTPTPARDSARVYFRLQWLHAPLEDTLAALGPGDLLPEQYPTSAATGDLLKGFGVATAALLTQTVLSSSDLGGHRLAAGVVALGGATAGVTAFFMRQSHRTILPNVRANAQRRADHATRNAQILASNAALLSEVRLIITPAAGTQ